MAALSYRLSHSQALITTCDHGAEIMCLTRLNTGPHGLRCGSKVSASAVSMGEGIVKGGWAENRLQSDCMDSMAGRCWLKSGSLRHNITLKEIE